MDLVEHGGGGGADLVGAPQLLDRAGDRAARLGLVAGHRRALVEVAQAREDARELLDRRAPPRLGRVGGHDEPQLGAVEHLAQLGGVVPRSARCWIASRSEPRAGASPSPRSRRRSRRTRSLSSARLTSWNQRVSERTSTWASSSDSAPTQLLELARRRRASPARARLPSATARSCSSTASVALARGRARR